MILLGLIRWISTIVGYSMPNLLYTHILDLFDLVCFGYIDINQFILFNANSSL